MPHLPVTLIFNTPSWGLWGKMKIIFFYIFLNIYFRMKLHIHLEEQPIAHGEHNIYREFNIMSCTMIPCNVETLHMLRLRNHNYSYIVHQLRPFNTGRRLDVLWRPNSVLCQLGGFTSLLP